MLGECMHSSPPPPSPNHWSAGRFGGGIEGSGPLSCVGGLHVAVVARSLIIVVPANVKSQEEIVGFIAWLGAFTASMKV